MVISNIKEAVMIGFILSFMSGPVFFMLIQTSILKGFRAAFSFDMGVVFGDILFVLIAFYGSRSFLSKIQDNPLLFKIGGLILVAYGVILFLNQKQKRIVQDESLVIVPKSNYLQLFFHGLFLNLINVGTLGFWLGMVLIYSARFQVNEAQVFGFFAIVLLSYLTTDIGKILLAKKLRDKMTPGRIYKIKKIIGVIFIIFGLILFSKSYIPEDKMPLKKVIDKQIESTY